MTADGKGLDEMIVRKNTVAMRLLEKLTPHGSEFCDDPERCYEYIRRALSHQQDIIKKKVIENRELRRLLRERGGEA